MIASTTSRLLFAKIMRISQKAVAQDASLGKIINMVSTDIDQLTYCGYLVPLMLSPLILLGSAAIMFWKIG